MTPEGAVLHDIQDYLTIHRIYFWRNGVGRRGGVSFGKVGSADILGILPGGRFLAIEVKAPGGKASLEQLEFLANIAKHGGMAFIADSVEIVEKHLQNI